jgi:hypothetical protein
MKQKHDTLRIVKKATIALKADAKTVFALLCPVKEVDWIKGWEDICTLVYTDSGIAEEACVFETNVPGEGQSLWICSRYDAAKTEITYIKHTIGNAVIKWDMTVRDTADGSAINMVYNMTSLSKEGNSLVRDYDERYLAILFEGLQKQINDYVTPRT